MIGVTSLALFMISGSMHAPFVFTPPSPPDLFSASGVALQLGLTPQSLAGAGMNGEAAETLLASLSSSEEDRLAIRALLEAVDAASTPEARKSARQALDAGRTGLRVELLENLSPEVDAACRAITTGHAELVPADLSAVACAETGYGKAQRVKRLLIAERRASRRGEELSEPIALELAALRGHETAIAVRARLASNLGDIESAFEGAWSSGEVPPP